MSRFPKALLTVAISVTVVVLGLWLATGAELVTKYEIADVIETPIDPSDPLADVGLYEGTTQLRTVTRPGFRFGLLPGPHILSAAAILLPLWVLILGLLWTGRRRRSFQTLALSILVVGCAGKSPTIEPAASGIATSSNEAHAIFSALLKQHVDDGRVSYKTLCDDKRLDRYISQLAATDPASIQDDAERLAFWINTYNAYTLKVICDNYPVSSINKLHFGGLIVGTAFKKTIWDKKFVVVNRENTSLNHIEHKIIRREFNEPRAHFALVCASVSCPRLRSEAFEGSRLDAQLEDQGRDFFNDDSKNFFEADSRIAHLSKILDWFSGDFGENREAVLTYVSRFLPDNVAAAIRADVSAWKVKYTDYDWGLNE